MHVTRVRIIKQCPIYHDNYSHTVALLLLSRKSFINTRHMWRQRVQLGMRRPQIICHTNNKRPPEVNLKLAQQTSSSLGEYKKTVNTRRAPNAGLMLVHRLRRWPNIKSALNIRLVFPYFLLGGGWSVTIIDTSAWSLNRQKVITGRDIQTHNICELQQCFKFDSPYSIYINLLHAIVTHLTYFHYNCI